MRIAIVGSGGVGGYYGGRLAAAGSDVVFIARGAHLAALKTNGLRIESPNGNLHLPRVNATDSTIELGAADVVFVTVKLYDMDSALALLPPLVGPDTVAIALQNGVESVEMLARAVPRERLAGGTTYIGAHVSEPGVIRHNTMGHLIFGETDGQESPRLERLVEACRAAGLQATLSRQIEVDIWSKFVHLSAFSGMTAVTRCPAGLLMDDPDLWAMWQAAVMETMAVARAKGVALPPNALATIIDTVRGWPPQAVSSLLQDLDRGRRLELPWLSGAVVRFGRELDVETPIHRFIAAVLSPHVNGKN